MNKNIEKDSRLEILKKLEVNNCNIFSDFLSAVFNLSPFQVKLSSRMINEFDDLYILFSESLIDKELQVHKDKDINYLAQSYVDYVKSIRKEEFYFAKNKKYRLSTYDEAYSAVYSKNDYMIDYMTGLALTLIMWPNHWRLVEFFLKTLKTLNEEKTITKILEIGVGHGVFHTEALKIFKSSKSIAYDVSSSSLNTTRKMLEVSGLDASRTTFFQGDIRKDLNIKDNSVDLLIMGEVIEHIDNVKEVLLKLSSKVKPDGCFYMTTAINSPAEDHILLFTTVEEVRSLLKDCGWNLLKENILTINNMGLKESESGGHSINYAALYEPQK